MMTMGHDDENNDHTVWIMMQVTDQQHMDTTSSDVDNANEARDTWGFADSQWLSATGNALGTSQRFGVRFIQKYPLSTSTSFGVVLTAPQLLALWPASSPIGKASHRHVCDKYTAIFWSDRLGKMETIYHYRVATTRNWKCRSTRNEEENKFLRITTHRANSLAHTYTSVSQGNSLIRRLVGPAVSLQKLHLNLSSWMHHADTANHLLMTCPTRLHGDAFSETDGCLSRKFGAPVYTSTGNARVGHKCT